MWAFVVRFAYYGTLSFDGALKVQEERDIEARKMLSPPQCLNDLTLKMTKVSFKVDRTFLQNTQYLPASLSNEESLPVPAIYNCDTEVLERVTKFYYKGFVYADPQYKSYPTNKRSISSYLAQMQDMDRNYKYQIIEGVKKYDLKGVDVYLIPQSSLKTGDNEDAIATCMEEPASGGPTYCTLTYIHPYNVAVVIKNFTKKRRSFSS